MKTKLWATALATTLALFAPTSSIEAQGKTQLLVRVTASDAKVVGSGVGGVKVTVREVASGRVLAEGIQEGGTGNIPGRTARMRERIDEILVMPRTMSGDRHLVQP